jgi:hypothetical protein
MNRKLNDSSMFAWLILPIGLLVWAGWLSRHLDGWVQVVLMASCFLMGISAAYYLTLQWWAQRPGYGLVLGAGVGILLQLLSGRSVSEQEVLVWVSGWACLGVLTGLGMNSLLIAPAAYAQVFRILAERLRDTQINWMIVGDTYPWKMRADKSIWIQTDQADAYAFERRLSEYVRARVAYYESQTLRCHYGRLNIAGIDVQVVGNFQRPRADGNWPAEMDWQIVRAWQFLGALCIPIVARSGADLPEQCLDNVDRAEISQLTQSHKE